MRNDKLPGAERLFDAIGMIDDVIITEAQTPYGAKTRASGRKQLRVILAVACAFAVITVGVFGNALLSGLLGSQSTNDEDAPAPESSAPTQTAKLEQFLTDAVQSGKGAPVDPEAVDFFDGTTKIIWRMEEDDGYYMLRVTSSIQTQRIQAQLKQDATALSPDKAESVGCSVWIAYGDGTVVSPYLKASAGNVGYAKLFAYAPEIEPSAELAELIEDSISD